MPLGKVAGERRRWLVNVTAYTLAGTLTSALVGAGLGAAGAAVLPDHVGWVGTALVLAVALLALARELGIVAVPLPQLGRQTRGVWANWYGARIAAVLWGLDLGLTFTTWVELSGVWVLATVAFVAGEPLVGAALFTSYWLGRALSVWVGPLLMTSASDTPVLVASLNHQHRLFRSVHVAGIAWSMVVIGVWTIVGTPL